ncbi:MAG TPA: hypothetical protein VMF52_16420 [Steroidobacteraceae bacterium]|nr:hypothetical protein [Steroidobacteraceae bacterium]
MPLTPSVRAQLYDVANGDPPSSDDQIVTVQFNPTTLSYSIQNTLRPPDRGAGAAASGGRAAQFVAQASAKLEYDLVFDTTHNGHDVRMDTTRIKEFLIAGGQANPNAAAPPVVVFAWGAFKFRGFIESMRESLDFFSEDGVPLRSSVKLSMTAQDSNAIFGNDQFRDAGASMDSTTQLVSVPPGGTTEVGGKGGNAGAGRGIAAANGLESMRNPGASLVAVASGSVQLKAAAAFSAGASAGFGAGASAGAGFGAGAGASFGAGASAGAGFGAGAGSSFGASAGASFGASAGSSFGAGAGAGASFGAGASAGAGLGAAAAFGASSSAGVTASAGAFSGLGASKTPTTVTLNTAAFQARATPNVVSADFAVGGRAVATASGGLTTNVGANARLRFD